MSTWEPALDGQSDLMKYGDNALGLFALALRFRLDDIDSVAANSLTDGSDDKKCDVVYIDDEERIAVVEQCYRSSKERPSAPSNKAADLNTGIAWLLHRPLAELPERLRPAAKELRAKITDGAIDELHIWYVHNLPESDNVRQELTTVEATANSALATAFPNARITVLAREIGDTALEKMYRDTLTPVLVTETVEFNIETGFEVAGQKWKAFITTISARQLRALYRKHKTDLFSANIRDYLGARYSDANINHGIRYTAENEAENFWVYNNGLTVLVNDFERVSTGGDDAVLKVHGISIVNGAQTTGAIGSLKNAPPDEARVPARFVKTGDTEMVQNIVQFNNSQNKVTASDFRSTDRVQKRLRDEMAHIPSAEYQGGRRGGYAEVIKRRPNLMPSYTVGQALAALHGDPAVAYNKKSEIWASDALYAKYFNDNTTALHIVFAYTLIRSIEDRKLELLTRGRNAGDLSSLEEKEIEFFRQRGSMYLYASAIGASLETILKRKIQNLFKLSFLESVSPHDARDIWKPVLTAFASLTVHLVPAVQDGLGAEAVAKAVQLFGSLVAATASANEPIYSAFRANVLVGGGKA